MSPKIEIGRKQLDDITNQILRKIFDNISLPESAIKKIVSKIDLSPVIKSVVSQIPIPKDGEKGIDGKNAEITTQLISEITIRAISKLQEIYQPPNDGKDGRIGERGLQGLSGRDGQPGAQGQIGLRGPVGENGIQGIIGDRGTQGIPGPVGLKGDKGDTGEPGQNSEITDEMLQDVANLINISDRITKKELDKSIKQLIKDISLGRVELPAVQELGGGLDGPQLINEISRVLGQSDWINGLPGNGTIGGNLEWIDLTDSPTDVPTGAGVLSWNMDEICMDIQSGIGPTLQVGQETYILIYNDLAGPITNGRVLRPKAATLIGDLVVPTVEKANASVFSTVEGTIMMATMDIPVETVGLATRFGRVRGIDTDGEAPGASVYVDTVDGEWTTSEPLFPGYGISIGGIIKADAVDGEIFVSVTRGFSDTILNFWNGTFRETIDFTVASTGGVITGSLAPDNGHPDMTMMFSDGFTTLDTDPAITIVLTAGTDNIPQQNFIYIPKSTKVLTVSTSDWPTIEHIKVADVVLRTAATTLTDGAYKNQNHNDHIEDTTSFQGHLSHMTAAIREKIPATWKNGVEGSASGFPGNFYVATTAGMVRQLHLQDYLSTSMPTDDIHIVNHPTTPNVTVSNLNGQTADALGVTLSNSSFSFVVWGIQNRTGTESHLACNLPIGKYAKNSPSSAVSDALNHAVYDIPAMFQSVGFLIARFTVILEADGTTWSLFDTEDLRGRTPNSTAGGGGGGTGVTTLNGLTDYPAAHVASQVPRVNAAGTAQDFTTLLPSGATQVAAGVSAGQFWRTASHATLPDNVILQGV